MINVVIAGFRGAMGQATVQTVRNQADMRLVAVFDPHATTADMTQLPDDVALWTTDVDVTAADVWIDFTTVEAAYHNAALAIQHGIHPIIGTSGLTPQQQQELQQQAVTAHLGGLIVPNFGLSAVLLMKFAQEAAQYFPDAEVIEYHHGDKPDAPSGTASATAHLIAKSRQNAPQPTVHNEARGADIDDVPVHAVRLPGLLAHEEVLFGGSGELLTIRQDTMDRSSFMTGVLLATRKVATLNELQIGLDKVL